MEDIYRKTNKNLNSGVYSLQLGYDQYNRKEHSNISSVKRFDDLPYQQVPVVTTAPPSRLNTV
jgi:hypothetical protein